MAENRKNVPLSEIEGKEVAGTSFNLHLPEFVDSDGIVFYPGKLNRMRNLGGIGQLEIVGREGETSRFVPTTVGHSPQGEGYAGATGKQEIIPTVRSSSLSQEYDKMPLPGRWARAQVVVNLSEVTDRIAESRPKGGIRSTKAWSRELDRAIRKGVRDAGQKQLLANEGGGYFGLAWPTLTGLGIGEYVAGIRGIPFSLLLTYTMEHLLERRGYNSSRNRGEPDEGFRFSIFPGIQLDRLAVLHGMSRATRVVRDRSNHK